MDKHLLVKALLSTLICTSLSSMAAPLGGAASDSASASQAGQQGDAGALARAQQKFTHALQVTRRFDAQAVQEGMTSENWRFAMIANLMKGSEQSFSQVEGAASYASAVSASVQVATQANSTATASEAKSLGGATTDLVYIPINPCRTADTRLGTQVNALTPTDFNFDAVNTGALACSVANSIPGGAVIPAALAANITIDDKLLTGFPTGSFLAVYPQGGTAGSSWVNFSPGEIIANSGVISINQSTGFFTVLTSAPAQVVVDVYGVFVAPQATALNCTTVSNTTALSLLSPTTVTTQCAAGYTMVGGGCSSTTLLGAILGTGPSDAFQSGANNYTCDYNALGALGILGNGTAHATCCRTPGR
jgi:hypothetical protein